MTTEQHLCQLDWGAATVFCHSSNFPENVAGVDGNHILASQKSQNTHRQSVFESAKQIHWALFLADSACAQQQEDMCDNPKCRDKILDHCAAMSVNNAGKINKKQSTKSPQKVHKKFTKSPQKSTFVHKKSTKSTQSATVHKKSTKSSQTEDSLVRGRCSQCKNLTACLHADHMPATSCKTFQTDAQIASNDSRPVGVGFRPDLASDLQAGFGNQRTGNRSPQQVGTFVFGLPS